MAYRRSNPGDRGQVLVGSIGIGGGGQISSVKRGTFTVDTSAISQFARETGTFTLTGATTGDIVACIASTSLNAGLILEAYGICTATSTITVGFVNHSSASVTQTSGLTNHYILYKIGT